MNHHPAKLMTVLIVVVAVTAGSAHAQQQKPNIIVIFTDDQGYADLGCQGVVKDVKTPHIDALAKHGVRMLRGYVSAPQCVPSRAGILTGRYQVRFGLETNLDGPLPHSETTMAEYLRQAGYVTGMVGKWHLQTADRPKGKQKGKKKQQAGRFSLENKFLPQHHGFDEFLCGPRRQYIASHTPKGEPMPKVPTLYQDLRFRIDVQTEAALSFIDRNAKKPFFLYLAYFAPHVPLEATPKYLRRFAHVKDEKRQTALAMISAMDDGVGAIVAELRKHNIEENTIIFFISDNGAPLRPNAWNGSLNGSLVGEKGMLTDGGIRVPFIVCWKGTLPAGKVYEHPVISLDVCATANAIAGLPHEKKLDGVNLMPYLLGKKKDPPHKALYWRWRSQAAVLKGRWKLVLFGDKSRHLFDMHSEEHEKKNVFNHHPAIAKMLEAELRQWSTTLTPAGLPKTIVRPDQYFLDTHLAEQ